MAVTVEMVRTEIADRPIIWPPYVAEPEIIGNGYGEATIFGLQFENYIPNTLTIYVASAPVAGSAPSFVAVNPSNYTVGAPSPGPDGTAATNAIITFTAAPASGSLIAARYQATAFSDTDLTTYLTNAQAANWPDDRTTLKAVLYDIIPAILADQRRCDVISQDNYRRDPSGFTTRLLLLRASLEKDLTGLPLPGMDVPAMAIAVPCIPRYGPLR